MADASVVSGAESIALGSLEGPALYVARELLPKITNVIVH